MKIILLKDIAQVGRRYDVKNVADGYALNMLIPRGMAVIATPDALKRIELEKAKVEGEMKLRQDLMLKNLAELDGVTITVTEKANEKGHLFAGIHKPELIAEILKQTRLQIDAEHILLDKPIKEVGVHQVDIKVGEKKVSFTLDIKSK